jgi:hypothetical protein
LRPGTAGINNSAFGFAALANNQGSYNTGIGAAALYVNSGGNFNTATGFAALYSNGGSDNTANGFDALNFNTFGGDNTADGFMALFRNDLGTDNTAVGSQTLFANTGSNNTGIGSGPLFSNGTGNDNTAVGFEALISNTTGSRNIALGSGAGSALGTGGPGDDNIEIGNDGGGFDAGTIRIGTQGTQGTCFIAGIAGVSESGPVAAVTINANGQLGTAPAPPPIGPVAISSRRFKKEMLNEFLEEHKAFLAERRKVQKQEAAIAELKSGMKALFATVKEQSSQIQKVSAQLELRKPSPQTVLNNQ